MTEPNRIQSFSAPAMTCHGCGTLLELPRDLTAVHARCAHCQSDNVLLPELIQARQRHYDFLLQSAEREQQLEQQRLLREKLMTARRAATRRSTIVVLVVVGLLLLVPALVVGGLFAVGIAFGKKAMHSLQELQDPNRNGMPAVMSEIRAKQAQGCSVLLGPQLRIGSGTPLELKLEANGPCVQIFGATAGATANLTLEQLSPPDATSKASEPAPTFDRRICPSLSQLYTFSVRSSNDAPFSVAAAACPRTVAEGLIRSVPSDPVTTGLSELRGWVEEFRAKGCSHVIAEPGAFQGLQVIDVESMKGGPCFNLLVVSHFGDAPLAVTLTSPAGKTLAKPTPASRMHLEYCPSESGKHQIEIVPATRDHYATASLDCPRRRSTAGVQPVSSNPR